MVYSLVKHSRPLSDIAEAIELQDRNGVRIAKHVAKEMKMTIFKDIIEEKAKICVIVDEASTVSKKRTLVIYVQCIV